MQTAVRMFALLIAVAGLAAASFTPGNPSAPSQHPIVTVNGPGPRQPSRSSALRIGRILHGADGNESLISREFFLGALLHSAT